MGMERAWEAESRMADTLIEYAHLPQIDGGEVRLLWHCDFWDGPRSGLCLYQGRK